MLEKGEMIWVSFSKRRDYLWNSYGIVVLFRNIRKKKAGCIRG